MFNKTTDTFTVINFNYTTGMKNNLFFLFTLGLLLSLFVACKKDEPSLGDMQHSDGNEYIEDNPNINTITISGLDNLDTTQTLLIKEALTNGSTYNQINLSAGSKKFKFVLMKYQNLRIFDNDNEILAAMGYVNNYKKNRVYMFIDKQGDLYIHFVLENVFYTIKKTIYGKYLITNINQNEDNPGVRYYINRLQADKIKNKEPIFVTPEFLNNNQESYRKKDNNIYQSLRQSKLSKYLNIVLNVSGSYPDAYPGSLYDNIYAMIHSFYSAFLTREDNGLNLDITIYIYNNRQDRTPWSDDSEEYLKSWKNNALLTYPEFNGKAENTIFVNMHLNRQWDSGQTIGRAYVLDKFGLGKFVIVGYADQFYHGAMQTLAHEVGHSLGAVHADGIYSKYNTKVYDVMQAYTGISNSKVRYREDHLNESNVKRIIFNWK